MGRKDNDLRVVYHAIGKRRQEQRRVHYHFYPDDFVIDVDRSLKELRGSFLKLDGSEKHVTLFPVIIRHPMPKKPPDNAIKEHERPAPQDLDPREDQYPPESIEKILYFALPRKDREALVGDLHEVYTEEVVPKFGVGYARWWYLWHAVIGILGIWWTKGRKYALFAVLGKLVDWLFQRIS